MTRTRWIAAAALLMAGCAAALAQATPDLEALKRDVADTERAFARSMAERDHAAFVRYLSEQAVFFNGPNVLHGKAEVAAAWKRFYDDKQAPFSWEPDHVEVLADGTLALSTGPVRDPSGKTIARFNSIWRLEGGGWRIVFDKGQPWEEPGR